VERVVEVEVEEVEWEVQVAEVAEVEVEGGVREGRTKTAVCLGWMREKEVGCVPDPLTVREPVLCTVTTLAQREAT